MDVTQPGQQSIFYFNVFVESSLYIFHCVFHILDLLLFHVFIYYICMVHILFICI